MNSHFLCILLLHSTAFSSLHFFYYWPQRSWAKVIFSQACVCPQGGVRLSTCWDSPPPGRQTSPQADPPLAGRPSPPGRQTPPQVRSMRDRYASYWNAFLFRHYYGLHFNPTNIDILAQLYLNKSDLQFFF